MRVIYIFSLYIFSLFLTPGIPSGHTAPWVPMNDLSLRADIQLLADSGIISAPVTTYPLMWQSIAKDINNALLKDLSQAEYLALENVKRSMQRSVRQKQRKGLKVYASTAKKRFTDFSANEFDRGNASIAYEYTGSHFSGRLQANHRLDVDEDDVVNDGKSNTFDGSYLAAKLGNWVISFGAIDRWWGPGLDSSLILSSNARPLPALSVTRNDASPFESAWLSWIGPWTFTSQMAQLESNRAVSEAMLWSNRGAFRPFRGLEIAASWSYQWGGEGQSESLRELFDGLTGSTQCPDGTQNCPEDNKSHLGNQLAGYDVRWSDTLLGMPYAIYGQMIGEDGPSTGKISDKAFLYGAETRFAIGQQRMLLNLEFSDTQVNCGADGDTSQDCYYEHGLYRSGYRYYRRAIGSTYDNDAKALVLTLLAQMPSGNFWQAKLRRVDLNTNNRDRFPGDVNLGNTVSKVAEDLTQLDLKYGLSVYHGKLTLGMLYTDSEINLNSTTDYDFYLQYEYGF